MEFSKYSEIENTYNKDFKNHLFLNEYNKVDAVATLKIDGSNISFHYDGNEYKVAKRTSFLEDNDNFYGIQRFKDQYESNVRDAYNSLKESYNDLNTVIIYGEIFGGYYKGVKTLPNTHKIQGRVNYSPDNHIIIYDIAITLGKNNDVKIYLNWINVQDICEEFGFMVVPEIARGTFGTLMKFDINNLLDPLCSMLKILDPNLPEITDNYAEGIVIKPLYELRFGNGARVIAKLKNTKFMESNEKSHEHKQNKSYKELLKDFNNEDIYISLIDDMIKYVTINRYHSVVSKIGEVTPKDFGNVIRNYHEDLVNDFKKDYPDSIYFSTNEKKAINIINKVLNKMISELVKKLLIFGMDDTEIEDNISS